MISSVRFQNFKSFENFKIDGLSRCNLISGRNNTGKSSILEGIFLFLDHSSPEVFLKLNRFRGIVSGPLNEKIWEPVFRNGDSASQMVLSAVLNNSSCSLSYMKDTSFVPSGSLPTTNSFGQISTDSQAAYTLRYSFSSNNYREDGHVLVTPSGISQNFKTSLPNNRYLPTQHTQFINHTIAASDPEINDWFGKLELDGKKQPIIDILKLIEPELTDILLISLNGMTSLYGKISGKMMPLKLCGDGINRLLYILLSIYENKHSVILIDEIESGFHYSLYPGIWNAISTAADRNDCQVIATTHSFECISGACDGIKAAGLENQFSYFRLDRSDGVSVHKYDYSLVSSAMENNMEVR